VNEPDGVLVLQLKSLPAREKGWLGAAAGGALFLLARTAAFQAVALHFPYAATGGKKGFDSFLCGRVFGGKGDEASTGINSGALCVLWPGIDGKKKIGS